MSPLWYVKVSAVAVLTTAIISALALVAHGAQLRAANGFHYLTLYSAVKKVQFVDNADDEARGYADNPFGFRNKSAAAAENEDKNGPFAGDLAFFSFTVYSDAARHKPVGVAAFTCQYYFDRNAFCDATYELKRGNLTAGGASVFDANNFTLAVTGGTGAYVNSVGEIDITEKSAGNSQQLHFVIR